MPRTAAHLLVDSLDAHGLDRAFCVPGESFLAVMDALKGHDRIQLVVCRHEAGAGFMAVADGRMLQRPGVCFVSRGPGACNASIALHAAFHDAVPMVLFVGQAERPHMGRPGLQEMNYAKTFSDTAKAVLDVVDPNTVSEICARAFHLATAGTPGPVVVVLPEDLLDDATEATVQAPSPPARPAPSPADADQAAAMLRGAKQPLVLAGGLLHGLDTLAALTRFAEAWAVPVVPTQRRPHLFDADHPLCAGYLGIRVPEPQLAAYMEADLVLALGERLSELTSQRYRFPRAPVPEAPLIHVWPDPAETGRVWRAALPVPADPALFLDALLARDPGPAPAGRRDWNDRLHRLNDALTAWPGIKANDGIVFGAAVAEVQKHLSPDAVVTSDDGTFGTWLHRHLRLKQTNFFLGTAVGAMGSGVPAAVAAALRWPERQTVCFVGDGGMLMTGAELATALQYGLAIKIIIADNANWGTIRYHQEKRYPGRPFATELRNPDFAALAEAHGARGFRVEADSELAPAIAEAMAHDGAALVSVRTSLQHISAWQRLDEVAG